MQISRSTKAPFNAVQFRLLEDKEESGWRNFEAVNLGKRPIVFLLVVGYAYDKDGKQVGRSKSLNWQDMREDGGIHAGKKENIRVGTYDDKLPDTAVTFELCVEGIQFKGDKELTRDEEACPDQKPQSK
ncbi:MAG: hypothetical protein HOW73_05865 [Polyangiaceae bacterium]|nr:hypothetical protein [Polyangiaceae bacterium]